MKEIELKERGEIERLTNKTFKFDSRVKEGWYTSAYFLKTAEIVERYVPNNIVTEQFFCRKPGIVCGLDECIALIHTFANNPGNLKITALNDGDRAVPLEPVLKITGRYQDFGFLENLIDGILARRTSVATNVYLAATAAAPSKVWFFGDRDDHFINQQGDGYAAYIGGVAGQCTTAMNEWWGTEGSGTMPHALIQIFHGDLVAASKAYMETYPNDKVTALVDFNNDIITDSLLVASVLKEKLAAVRVDTSISLIDKYFETFDSWKKEGIDPHGVNPTLVAGLRKALVDNGYGHVKIIVSSGFDLEKIKQFKEAGVFVDSYGIGSSLLKVNISFTGDLVNIDGTPLAKVGRHEIMSDRLKEVKYKK